MPEGLTVGGLKADPARGGNGASFDIIDRYNQRHQPCANVGKFNDLQLNLVILRTDSNINNCIEQQGIARDNL